MEPLDFMPDQIRMWNTGALLFHADFKPAKWKRFLIEFYVPKFN